MMNPRRSTPAAMQTRPVTMAIRLATMIARAGSPADSGSTTAKITAASEESGPSTRMRLGPSKA